MFCDKNYIIHNVFNEYQSELSHILNKIIYFFDCKNLYVETKITTLEYKQSYKTKQNKAIQ